MPCMDGGPPTPTNPKSERNKEVDKLSQMLCACLTFLADTDYDGEFCKYVQETTGHGVTETEIYDWYKKHLVGDKSRAERLKKSALSKLTEEEKDILGLK